MGLNMGALDPSVREAAEYAVAIAAEYGIKVTITSTGRSLSEQQFLYNRYQDCLRRKERVWPGNKNAACRYPAAAPGRSAHGVGLAFDSWVAEKDWPLWNAIRAAVGFRLDPNDRVHAEHPAWKEMKNRR